MANILKNFLDSLHLSDDDDDDDDEAYDNYVDRVNSRERRQTERREKRERESARPVRSFGNDSGDEDLEVSPRSSISSIGETRRERERSQKAERQASKVVPFRSSSNGVIGICVMKPTNVEDSQDICDVLLSGSAIIINLNGFDAGQAQRVMDFISGSVYAIQGKLHQISDYIFIVSPSNIDISGDYLDILKQNGFEVPVINRDL